MEGRIWGDRCSNFKKVSQGGLIEQLIIVQNLKTTRKESLWIS